MSLANECAPTVSLRAGLRSAPPSARCWMSCEDSPVEAGAAFKSASWVVRVRLPNGVTSVSE